MASASTAKAKGLAQAERRLARLSARPLTVREWLRFALRTLGILLGLLVSVPLHYLYRVFAYGSPFPMLFLRYTAWVVGARVQVRGTPLRRDVFFIANHVSWVDILALAGATGTAFVAKYELSQVPVIGWLCRLNRTVFVKRENRMDVAQQINALKEALADNWSVTVFPEGTTTDGKSLLPFKSSMLSVLEPPPPGGVGRLGQARGAPVALLGASVQVVAGVTVGSASIGIGGHLSARVPDALTALGLSGSVDGNHPVLEVAS